MKFVRRFVTIFLVAAAGAGGLWLTGRGSHPLTLPPTVVSVTPDSDSYVYSDAGPSHSSQYVLPVLDSYLRDIPAGARVLDLGSGTGGLLASFEGRGWDRVDRRGMALMQANNVQIVKANAKFVSDVKAKTAPLEQKWVKDAEAKGLKDAAKVLAEFRAEIAKQEK